MPETLCLSFLLIQGSMREVHLHTRLAESLKTDGHIITSNRLRILATNYHHYLKNWLWKFHSMWSFCLNWILETLRNSINAANAWSIVISALKDIIQILIILLPDLILQDRPQDEAKWTEIWRLWLVRSFLRRIQEWAHKVGLGGTYWCGREHHLMWTSNSFLWTWTEPKAPDFKNGVLRTWYNTLSLFWLLTLIDKNRWGLHLSAHGDATMILVASCLLSADLVFTGKESVANDRTNSFPSASNSKRRSQNCRFENRGWMYSYPEIVDECAECPMRSPFQ